MYPNSGSHSLARIIKLCLDLDGLSLVLLLGTLVSVPRVTGYQDEPDLLGGNSLNDHGSSLSSRIDETNELVIILDPQNLGSPLRKRDMVLPSSFATLKHHLFPASSGFFFAVFGLFQEELADIEVQ